MKKLKRMCGLLSSLLILVIVTSCFQPQIAHADTHYTKAKLTEMLNKSKKEATAAKQKWNSEKKKYQAQTQGTTGIYGNIICINPFIVKDSWTNSYYWVTDYDNLTRLYNVATGSVKLTGTYKNYNGITCAVGRAVKVTANPAEKERNYTEKAKKVNELKQAIKNYAKFNTKKKNVYLGKKTQIYYKWRYSNTYNNKNNFKVSYDKKMVKLTYDNYSIYVTPLKEGSTKIKITNELVKKNSILTLNIEKKANKDNKKNDSVKNGDDINDKNDESDNDYTQDNEYTNDKDGDNYYVDNNDYLDDNDDDNYYNRDDSDYDDEDDDYY